MYLIPAPAKLEKKEGRFIWAYDRYVTVDQSCSQLVTRQASLFCDGAEKTGDPDRRLCGAFDRLRCGRAGHYARTSGRGVFSAGVAAAELHLYWAYDVVGRFALAAHCPGAGAAVSGGDGGAVRILAVHPHRQILLCRHACCHPVSLVQE